MSWSAARDFWPQAAVHLFAMHVSDGAHRFLGRLKAQQARASADAGLGVCQDPAGCNGPKCLRSSSSSGVHVLFACLFVTAQS